MHASSNSDIDLIDNIVDGYCIDDAIGLYIVGVQYKRLWSVDTNYLTPLMGIRHRVGRGTGEWEQLLPQV